MSSNNRNLFVLNPLFNKRAPPILQPIRSSSPAAVFEAVSRQANISSSIFQPNLQLHLAGSKPGALAFVDYNTGTRRVRGTI